MIEYEEFLSHYEDIIADNIADSWKEGVPMDTDSEIYLDKFNKEAERLYEYVKHNGFDFSEKDDLDD